MIRPEKGPMKLYVGVGNLHCNISDEILKGIFEPFGRIQSIQLIRIRRRTDPLCKLGQWVQAPHLGDHPASGHLFYMLKVYVKENS